jgi:hypothetical protein
VEPPAARVGLPLGLCSLLLVAGGIALVILRGRLRR